MSRATATPALGPRLGFDRSRWIRHAVALAAVVVVFGPILPILYQAFRDRPLYDSGGRLTLANLAKLLRRGEFLAALGNSLELAALTTLIAGVVGVAAALAVGRTDMPGRRLIGEILLWPLYISHLVLAFAFNIMYGPSGFVTMFANTALGGAPWDLYTVPGMAVVAGISQAPLTLLYCLSSTSIADPALEDAARISGAGPLRTLRSISLPLLRPAIVYSAVLNFTIALELLAIPIVFGSPTGLEFLTTFLYDQGISAATPDYGLVGSAALLLLLIVTGLVWLQGRLLGNAGRFVTLGGKAARPRLFPLGRLRWPVFALFLAYVVMAVLVPLAGLVLRALTSFLSPLVPFWEVLTTAHFEMIAAYPANLRSIWNTVLISALGGAFATGFVALIALVAHRSEYRFARALEFVALYPRAVPGLVAGIGFLWAMLLFRPLGWLHNTIWILVVAYTMRYVPTGFGAVAPMLLQIGRDLDRSARTAGADWWTTCRAVLIPLLKPALFSAFAVLFIQFFKEYAVAVFLYAPGSEVIGTTLLSYWIQGDAGPVAALSTVQVLLTFGFVYAVRRLAGVRVYG